MKKRERERENDSNGRELGGVRVTRRKSERAMGKQERSNKRGVRNRLANDTQIKWRCARSRLCGEAVYHEMNDDEGGGMRRGDDETEGEMMVRYERTTENEQGQERKE